MDPNSSIESDEALARALQKEYEKEFRRSQMRQSNSPSHRRSAPTAPDPPEAAAWMGSTEDSVHNTARQSRSASTGHSRISSLRTSGSKREPTMHSRSSSRSARPEASSSHPRRSERLTSADHNPSTNGRSRSSSRPRAGEASNLTRGQSAKSKSLREQGVSPSNTNSSRSSSARRSRISHGYPPPMGEHSSRATSAVQSDDAEVARRLEQSMRDEKRVSLSSASYSRRSLNRTASPSFAPSSRDVPVSEPVKDEDFARRLQQEIEREEAMMRSSSRPSALTQQQIQSNPTPPTSQTSSEEADDEDLARRLQQEIEEEEEHIIRASSSRFSSSNHEGSQYKLSTTPVTSRASSAVSSPSIAGLYDDEELAVRVEQEMKDEALAREMMAREQERASARRARQVAVAPPPRRCTPKRVCSIMLPILIVGGAVAGVAFFFTRGGDLPDFFPSPEDFRREDPFSDMNPDDADKWRNNGEGLGLQIINALEDKWYTFFNAAVADWEAGTPDVLTLSTSYKNSEYECSPVNYKLKVCNGDYGNTQWRGINKILLSDGYIFASSAKMNDFYLEGSSDAQKQYTMCHEIGHGFGLPHSDESFTNKDLGNCMDYTNNPEANMHPDASNFEFLAELYGVVPGSTTVAPEVEESDPGNRRAKELKEIPAWVLSKWHSMDTELDNHSHGSEALNGWRLLHASPHTEAHEIDIGEGYSIRVHKFI